MCVCVCEGGEGCSSLGRASDRQSADSGSVNIIQWGGGGCSSLGRASDRHSADDAGPIPPCGKLFFFQSQLSVQTLTVPTHPRVQSHALSSASMVKLM